MAAYFGQYKLFIAPVVHDQDAFLRVLREPAKCCCGLVYVAMVPHPDSWEEAGKEDIRLWVLDDGEWLGLNSRTACPGGQSRERGTGTEGLKEPR